MKLKKGNKIKNIEKHMDQTVERICNIIENRSNNIIKKLPY